MITLVAENTGKAVFEGVGLSIIGSYWHVYGIYVKDSTGVGIQINGNNNIIECVQLNIQLTQVFR